MRIIINEEIIEKHGLTVAEFNALLLIKECDGKVSLILNKLISDNKITIENGDYIIPISTNDLISTILLNSDKSIPADEELEDLVEKLRELFPKGFKTGSSSWRGNKRELILRLKKFFKLYGKYSKDEIYDATKRYVESFNGDYTKMRILKYFIMKTLHVTNEEGITTNEDISDLATLLENTSEINNGYNTFIELR